MIVLLRPQSIPTANRGRAVGMRFLIALFVGMWCLDTTTTISAAEPMFESEVAPLLAARCLTCHGTQEHKGGLNLSQRATALKGGESGPAIEPGKLDESLMWEKISGDEMPPKKPLKAEEKAILKAWLLAGAKWGSDPIDPLRYSSDHRAGYDWWSLKPVKQPELPVVKQTAWPRNGIDHFVLARLEAKGLAPAPEADRRTCIRRLSFDLLGLPPTPQEVAAFEADRAPDAYEQLVQRYLDSPAYGERWARHWLDVVRYGESQGFERDKLRPNSWRYRDWVVWALNRDMPYEEFVRLQIAGDVLAPDDPLAVIATGYLVAAPWDEVGQSQQSAVMRAIVRQDELEDVIGTTTQTFLGLTANCARCHDHKFDPISQREYYQLAASLGGVRHGERESLSNNGRDATQKRIQELDTHRQELAAALATLETPIREKIRAARQAQPPSAVPVPAPIARWEFDRDLQDSVGALHGTAFGNAKVEQGRLILDGQQSYVASVPLLKPLTAKTFEVWVKLSNLKQQGGGVLTVQNLNGATFDSLVFAEREPGKWFPGSEGFQRSVDLSEAEPEAVADKEFVQLTLVYHADQTVTMYRNGRPYGRSYKASSLPTFEAEKAQVVFGMRHGPVGGNKMLAGEIERAQLYDRALTPQEVAASAGVPAAQSEEISIEAILSQMTVPQRTERQTLVQTLTQIEAEQRLLQGGPTYAVAPRQPEATHVLSRGNPATPAEEVSPSGIHSLGDFNRDYDLPKDSTESDRRIKLANWITDARNPLTARVIVNRLWHYHFGVGIVDTPNDFGFNGTRPSHPELLDWLASELTVQKGSLKALHRTIVLSATYRQGTQFNARAHAVDADNRLLWRKTPVRLEAEAVRDAVLTVTGELNPTMGGPSYQDFKTFTSNSQFYEQIDPVGYALQRRSLYRMWVRSGRNSLLDVLDCPDPSTTAPKRAVTTTPLQALALLNNSFLLRMCDKLAEHIQGEADLTPAAQVARAYQLTFQRTPTDDEQKIATPFVEQHGLSALARVLFNSNEFLYVD